MRKTFLILLFFQITIIVYSQIVKDTISDKKTKSAIGYYCVTLDEYSVSKPLIIFLEPKVFELQEVVIKAKAINRQRRANMVLFRKNPKLKDFFHHG